LSLRILQICNKPLLPAIDGGALAMWRMAQGLSNAGHQVTVLSIHTTKHPWLPEKIGEENIRKFKMDSVYVDTSVRWLPAFLSLFKTSSYNIDRFYNLGFEARLTEVLARTRFDIVQLESLYMCPYIGTIRRLSQAKIVLRAHNTESAIWQKNAEEETDPFKKLWFRDLAGKLERYEIKSVNEVDAVLPITTDDEKRLKAFITGRTPLHTVTFAMPPNVPVTGAEENAVFHIGSMDWKPNYDGVQWLVNEIWPKVMAAVPGAKLHLAGRDMRKEEFEGKAGIVSHGEVADAAGFMSRFRIMAIPLRSGGGIKVKAIEGMFAGKAIVTTTIGAEGISMQHNKEYLHATTAGEFAEHLITLLKNAELAAELGRNAQKCAAENHELARVTGKLSDFYISILR
jgi:glycosyltransferase involved in cell wall biosynthesis